MNFVIAGILPIDLIANTLLHQISNTRKVISAFAVTFSGKSMQPAEELDRKRVAKLTEMVYMMCKESIAFRKFPEIANLEKRHGVDIGDTYISNDSFCCEISGIIGQVFFDNLVESLNEANFFSILTDGSTDSGIQEKELVFVTFVGKDGVLQTSFLKLKSVTDGKASGLKDLILGLFIVLRNLEISEN